jgi:hypothetical protein
VPTCPADNPSSGLSSSNATTSSIFTGTFCTLVL